MEGLIDFPKEREQFEESALAVSIEVIQDAFGAVPELKRHLKNVFFQQQCLWEGALRNSMRSLPADIAHGNSEFLRGRLDALDVIDALLDPADPVDVSEEFEE